MGNCLVTKLKGSVDNPNLDYLGYIKLSVVNAPSAVKLVFNIMNNGKAIIKGDGYFTDDTGAQNYGKETSANAATAVYSSVGTYNIIIKKDDIQQINFDRNPKQTFVSLNIEDLSYCSSLSYMLLNYINPSGNIDNVKGTTKVSNISIGYCAGITGSISGIIKNFPNLRSLTMPGTKITGSLDEFISNDSLVIPTLTSLNVTDCSKLTKSAETIEKLRSLGVTVTN